MNGFLYVFFKKRPRAHCFMRGSAGGCNSRKIGVFAENSGRRENPRARKQQTLSRSANISPLPPRSFLRLQGAPQNRLSHSL